MGYIKEAVKNIIIYIILSNIMLNMVSAEKYKKYVRMFTGLVLILLVISPILKLFSKINRIDLNLNYNIEEIEDDTSTLIANKDIEYILEKNNIKVADIDIKLQRGEICKVVIKMNNGKDKDKVKKIIQERYNIDADKVIIRIAKG